MDQMSQHEVKQCEAFGCNLPGIYTDPVLDGAMYCLHHRRRAMDSLKAARIKDLEAGRDHWKALAEKRGLEVERLAAGIHKLVEGIKKLRDSVAASK